MTENGHNPHLFMPQQISKLTLDEIKERMDPTKRVGLKTGLDDLDAHMLPMRPGELIVVNGCTSNGKSSLMRRIASNCEEQIRFDNNLYVVFVSYEQSVEEQGMVDIAALARIDATKMHAGELNKAEFETILAAAVERGSHKMSMVGHSSRMAAQKKETRPMPTLPTVAEALNSLIYVQGRVPALVVLDHLQRIPAYTNFNRPDLNYSANVDFAKDMAISFNCPVILGSQAKQDVVTRGNDWHMPGIYDGQQTSNIAQSADKVLSVWLPHTSVELGKSIRGGYMVTENLLLIGLLKQRFGKANKVVPFHIDYGVNEMHSIDKIRV